MTKPRIALIYDTETTGLPIWTLPSEDPSQPRIIQLAAELINLDSREVVAGMHFLIKPEGWTIPEEITAITGITTEKAAAFGVPIAHALAMFLQMWHASTAERIAHNESFDMRMIRIELMKSKKYTDDYADEWKQGAAFCTCVNSTKIVNAPPTERMLAAKRKGPKPPNLQEAYLHFTGQPLVGAHNARADTEGCKAVYFGIQEHNQALAAA